MIALTVHNQPPALYFALLLSLITTLFKHTLIHSKLTNSITLFQTPQKKPPLRRKFLPGTPIIHIPSSYNPFPQIHYPPNNFPFFFHTPAANLHLHPTVNGLCT